MDAEELAFEALQAVMPGAVVTFVEGNVDDDVIDMDNVIQADLDQIGGAFYFLGEMAEKPISVKSSIEKIKTRNYQIPGKRSTMIELRVNGIGVKQKDYLESLGSTELSIMISDFYLGLANPSLPDYPEPVSVLILNGLRWTVDFSGETDGLWQCTLTTEIQGSTRHKVMPVVAPAYVEEEE